MISSAAFLEVSICCYGTNRLNLAFDNLLGGVDDKIIDPDADRTGCRDGITALGEIVQRKSYGGVVPCGRQGAHFYPAVWSLSLVKGAYYFTGAYKSQRAGEFVEGMPIAGMVFTPFVIAGEKAISCVLSLFSKSDNNQTGWFAGFCFLYRRKRQKLVHVKYPCNKINLKIGLNVEIAP